MITPWDRDNTMDIDEVYVQLTLLRDDRKLPGTTQEECNLSIHCLPKSDELAMIFRRCIRHSRLK